ncbi:hypothetical protein V498_01650 [Pseudogymnoascus sp. VKM F-4517 (FW-2822)]|nr:hypothetical protein V498_01650 [Pseudogymnoascus sp. VKM F-4517 (FW-2822)]
MPTIIPPLILPSGGERAKRTLDNAYRQMQYFKPSWVKALAAGKYNIQLTMARDGDYWQQSVILVPANASAIKLKRMLSVFGYDDAPHGHGHFVFTNVRVPASNIIMSEGRGFEIIQGRLGLGRIHRAMRAIGVWIAEARLHIDAARLIVLNASIKFDGGDEKVATKDISQAKILAPRVALGTLDKAIQSLGGSGVSQDTPMAAMWAQARTPRIVDGPDEVHYAMVRKKRGEKWTVALTENTRSDFDHIEPHGSIRAIFDRRSV